MKRSFFILLTAPLLFCFFIGCKKHTLETIRGKWERIIIDTIDENMGYGHRQLIKQIWDFRDAKYVYIESTGSPQYGAIASSSSGLDPLPIVIEERKVYEIPKRRKLNIIKEGSPPYVENYVINILNDEILSMSRYENGKNAGVAEFVRVKD